jgi:TRAP-type C4-dicarboxylate transport system permease small subunit
MSLMENDDKISVPFVMEHMSANNRRMFHALLTVCITFVLTIIIFVVGYTIRERNWLDTVLTLSPEVNDGIHQQPDP